MFRFMTRSWLRRTLSLLFGAVFAASMSVSAVQAATMAVKMTMAPAMAAGADKCPDCESGRDTKAMDCQPSACTSSAVATLTPTSTVGVDGRGHHLLVSLQSSLVGRPPAPDPYPPRPAALC